MALGPELFYPDCQHCSASGLIYVQRVNNDNGMFRCHRCDNDFDPETGSKWHGVYDLTERYRDAYIAVEIQGYTVREYARQHRLDVRTVESYLKHARQERKRF